MEMPIVRGSIEDWWNGLTDKDRARYGGEANVSKRWAELSQALRNSLCILTLPLKDRDEMED